MEKGYTYQSVKNHLENYLLCLICTFCAYQAFFVCIYLLIFSTKQRFGKGNVRIDKKCVTTAILL